MQVAICTDIHGNRHAFEAVIDAAREAGRRRALVPRRPRGHGAEPDACVALATEHCSICLAGNHDLAVVEVLSLEDFSRGAALAARWTQEVISDETRDTLLGLQPAGEAEGFGLFHASPRDPIWEYVLSGLTAELCFDSTDFRVSFIGHSHVALSSTAPRASRRPARPSARELRSISHKASGWSTRAPPASRATATRAPPGCCSTPRPRSAPTCARSTTSRAPRRRSARRGCRTRWPNVSSTGSNLARSMRRLPLLLVLVVAVLAGCGQSNPDLIPQSNAQALTQTADKIQAACTDADRSEARAQIRSRRAPARPAAARG